MERQEEPIDNGFSELTSIWILNWLQTVSRILQDRELKITAKTSKDNQEQESVSASYNGI